MPSLVSLLLHFGISDVIKIDNLLITEGGLNFFSLSLWLGHSSLLLL